MSDLVRCPYCVEGKGFKVMVNRAAAADYYKCMRCGHLARPTNPGFICTCAKCNELNHGVDRGSESEP